MLHACCSCGLLSERLTVRPLRPLRPQRLRWRQRRRRQELLLCLGREAACSRWLGGLPRQPGQQGQQQLLRRRLPPLLLLTLGCQHSGSHSSGVWGLPLGVCGQQDLQHVGGLSRHRCRGCTGDGSSCRGKQNAAAGIPDIPAPSVRARGMQLLAPLHGCWGKGPQARRNPQHALPRTLLRLCVPQQQRRGGSGAGRGQQGRGSGTRLRLRVMPLLLLLLLLLCRCCKRRQRVGGRRRCCCGRVRGAAAAAQPRWLACMLRHVVGG